ncbi:hypothetical protein BvCmsKSP071_02000 [Escherichia coli]|nr:hypothetical protein BvCmsKSP071_02000 [Escherichia coli]
MCGIRAPGKGFLIVNGREYFQCSGITPVLRSRQGTHRLQNRLLQNIRIVVTTITRNRNMAYRLLHHLFKHRTHIIGGDTFAVCRHRYFRDRIIHRQLQYFRIVITTVTRSRDMAYGLFHHLLKHRTHIIGGDTFAVRRYRNSPDRIIHRQLQYFRIVITTITRNRNMAHCLCHHLFKHRTHIIRGETFTVRRLRNICDRIIHRLLQYFRIVITTITRNRDMAYRLLHHLLKHRTHIIARHALL